MVEIFYNGNILGYVPRYYSQAFARFINEKRIGKSYIENIDKNKCCDECITIKVKISQIGKNMA
jgi:hypothetical protein